MKLLIEIDKNLMNAIKILGENWACDTVRSNASKIAKAIRNGTPLPHGICGVIANGEPLPDDVKED